MLVNATESAVKPVRPVPSPVNEPVKEPDKIEVAPVEVITEVPNPNVEPSYVIPELSTAPPVPATSMLSFVKLEAVTDAR